MALHWYVIARSSGGLEKGGHTTSSPFCLALHPLLASLLQSGLQGLSLASGSLVTLLRMAHVLLSAPQAPLPSDVETQSVQFAAQLRKHLVKEHDTGMLAEMEGGDAVSGGPGWGELPRAFDTTSIPSGINVKDGGMLLEASGTSNAVVCVNGPPFTKGKAAWEFKLVRDTPSGQCTCFGATKARPCPSSSYNSSHTWMYRSYNGYNIMAGTHASTHTLPNPRC